MRRLMTGRIHKRPFIVTIAVITIFLIAGALVVLYLGFFRQTSQTAQIRVESEITGMDVHGLGINIGTIPTPNMVLASSFEHTASGQFFTVYEGSTDYVYLLQNDENGQVYSDGSFTGGTVRVMSLDEQGRMVQKIFTDILDFRENQFGPQTKIEELGVTESGKRFIVSSETRTVVFFQSGHYITDLTTSARKEYTLPASAEIIAASEAGGRFSTLAEDWSVHTSTDGRNFNYHEAAISFEESPKTVVSIDKVIVAAGEGGKMISYCDGERIEVPFITDADLLASAGDGKTALIVGTKGTMLTSSNGIIFRVLDLEEMPFSEMSIDWVCATFLNGRYIIVGRSGETAVGTYDPLNGRFQFSGYRPEPERGHTVLPQSILADSSGEILLLSEDGKTFILSEDMKNWKELYDQGNEPVEALGRSADSRLILVRNGEFNLTRLLTRVEYSEHTSDTAINAGDMCYLSAQTPAFDGNSSQSKDGLWQVYGEDFVAQVVDDAPPLGGSSSLRLFSGDDQLKDRNCFISQIISSEGSATLLEKTFYRIEVWLKQNNMAEGEVMAWISGDFESVGTVFTDVGNNWRHYSAILVLPSEACEKDAGDIRLNIGFSGEGELFLDKIYFGPDKFSSEAIADEYLNVIREIDPGYIRLNNVAFGLSDIRSDSYYFPAGNEGVIPDTSNRYISQGCVSLEASLRMTRYAGANPWLIIEASADQEQIEHLMEYFCGSISEPFGKMRIDNGTAVPWSNQFERIVFEIADSEGLFKTDLQRGAFVDFIISVMKSSPYYLDIKDRVIFLDGMLYSGGSMLSTADFHSSSIHLNVSADSTSNVQNPVSSGEIISTAYLDYYDRIPRILSRPREQLGEWIYSAKFRTTKQNVSPTGTSTSEKRITAATYIDFILHDLGGRTSMICLDLPVHEGSFDFNRGVFTAPYFLGAKEGETVKGNVRTLIASLSALNGSIYGAPLSVKIQSAVSDDGEKGDKDEISTDQDQLKSYAYIDGDSVCVIITNTGDEPKQFRIEADFTINQMVVDHFSESGEMIGAAERRSTSTRFTLLPGQFMIAKGTTGES